MRSQTFVPGPPSASRESGGAACPVCRPGGPHLYRHTAPEGTVVITEYNVFPGIWLAYKEADAFGFPYPASYPEDLLAINYCRSGRLEYEDHARYFFLGPGDLSIHRSAAGGAVLSCPTKQYQGLSVLIDPKRTPPCTDCLLRDVNVRMPELYAKFCEGERHFIMRSTAQLEHIFSQLFHLPASIRLGYCKVKVLELLLFLACLEPERSQWEQRGCTAAQRALARDVIRYADAHRGERLTAGELALALHASPEQLRRSVKKVYGKTLNQCIRAYKMRLAAKLLRETGRTVSDIAGEFGYDNSSKFASAFRAVLGALPGDYRAGGPPG